MLIAQSAFPHYVDTDGSPITSGSLYYGTVGANPRTSPVAIYWDAAGTQPAPQPVRTVAGYPVRNGSPANVYINGAYSVALYNAGGELVFYAPDSTYLEPVLPGSVSIDKLDLSTQALINGALQKAGGTMTGALVLTGNASNALEAVPKQQLDAAVPPGAVQAFAMSSAPTGWLKANGAAVSRVTYAPLFAAIGTAFGVGDGSTTFNLPDLRGEFVRGWDDGRGVDSARAFGSAQSDLLKSHTHDLQQRLNTTNFAAASGSGVAGDSGTGVTIATGGAETRPRNVALLYCIKF